MKNVANQLSELIKSNYPFLTVESVSEQIVGCDAFGDGILFDIMSDGQILVGGNKFSTPEDAIESVYEKYFG